MSDTPLITRRRLFVAGGAAAVVGAGAFAATWFNVTAQAAPGTLTPQDAHRAAAEGRILLIDIRRPDEWTRTGLGEGAMPLDMRRPDFTDALTVIADNDTARPIALICARGVRSRRLTARLTAAGFTNIIDIPEGMLGSGAGPGWLKRALPTVTYQG